MWMWSANCIWPNDDCAPMRIMLSRAVFNFHIAVFFVCVLHMFNDQLDRAGQRTGGECIEEEEDPSWVTWRIGVCEGRGTVGRRLLYIGVGCVILDIHIYLECTGGTASRTPIQLQPPHHPSLRQTHDDDYTAASCAKPANQNPQPRKCKRVRETRWEENRYNTKYSKIKSLASWLHHQPLSLAMILHIFIA